MKTKLMTFILALASSLVLAQHDHPSHDPSKTQASAVSFKDAGLGVAYNHYLHIKDALVSSNADDAKKAAGELQKALKEVKGSNEALTAVTKLVNTNDLEEQRLLFNAVSNEMMTLVDGGQLSAGEIYLEYCPMANKNEGAYWLSNEKQIRNPYFGDKMLKCGKVKRTIQ